MEVISKYFDFGAYTNLNVNLIQDIVAFLGDSKAILGYKTECSPIPATYKTPQELRKWSRTKGYEQEELANAIAFLENLDSIRYNKKRNIWYRSCCQDEIFSK